jgi:methylase of polypeptide subunit release factors
MKKQEIYNFGKKLGINIKKINLILEKITGLNKEQLFLIEQINDDFLEEIENYFSRVVSGEPIEYILEKANFY